MQTMNPTPLNAKAMLVKLTVRKATLTKRDQVAESLIQQQMDDTSLIVNSKLFRDKANPINKIMGDASMVYKFHVTNTLPYMDKGPRILPNNNYMEYTKSMREHISHVDTLLNQYMPKYDEYVQLDIAYRSKGQTATRAKAEDYPSADDFRSRMGFDIRFLPLPEAKHFLFDISDEDLDTFNQTLTEAEQLARADTIKRMLEPLTHLVTKLNTPIGADGSVFRDTAVTNVIEGLQIARKLNIDDNAELNEQIQTLSQTLSLYGKDSLRESPVVREQAAKKLDAIANKMAMFI